MPKIKELNEVINGFKVIKDLGRGENDIRYALVICKECGKKFETSIYHINKIKSCGCLPCRPPKMLPREINGFKILKDFGYNNGSRRALVVCKVCNKEYEVDPNKLRYRHHCGCIKKGSIVNRYYKEYKRLGDIYKHMIARCYRSTSADYYNYGFKGITVCDEWKKDRNIFVEWSLSNGYNDDLTLDRIDFTKGYSSENCRWADSKTQARNTSRNVLTMAAAEKMREEYGSLTLDELAKKYNVSRSTVWLVVNNITWVK